MIRKSKSKNRGDGQVAWISMTDVYLLFSILLIGIVMLEVSNVKKEREDLTRVLDPFVQIKILDNDFTVDEATDAVQDYIDKFDELEKKLDLFKDGSKDTTKLVNQISELEKNNTELRAEIKSLEKAVTELKDKLESKDEIAKGNEGLVKKVAELRDNISNLKTKIDILEEQNKFYKEQLDPEKGLGEGNVRIGLTGLPDNKSLDKVVFLIDKSDSMDQKFGTKTRWKHTKEIIFNWLDFLPMKELGLIFFCEDASLYEGDWIKVSNDSKKIISKVAEIKSHINSLDTAEFLCANTDHIAALRLAFSTFENIDAIIIITDGATAFSPHTKHNGFYTDSKLNEPEWFAPIPPELKMLITCLRTQKTSLTNEMPPIHIIGIGDYFNTQMKQFINTVHNEVDGVFIGR